MNRFQQTSDLHKEMLAILSAITEVIKERNGTQSSTEFFLGLVSIQTFDDIFMVFYHVKNVHKWNGSIHSVHFLYLLRNIVFFYISWQFEIVHIFRV